MKARDEAVTGSPLGPYVPRILAEGDLLTPRCWEADGTLVFADVSGFTRLTERLSKRGKIGAEEIVQTISAVFTALLSASADDGGDVLKFSGDALLLFYDGDDHARRACHAALTMQRRLRDVGGTGSQARAQEELETAGRLDGNG
jgi:class 3 adenylate cyclase